MTTADKSWERRAPEDVLTKTTFHKVLVLFNAPASWSAGRTVAAALLPLAIVGLAWWLAAGSARANGGRAIAMLAPLLLATYVLSDALLFAQLPRSGLSFGAWQAQTVAMLFPRTAAALLAAVVAAWTGPIGGLATLIGLQMAGSLTLVWGVLEEPFRLRLTELDIESQRLPAGSEPIRLLHISDLHIERLTKRERRLLQLVAEAEADLIVITGDYLNLSYTRDPAAHRDVRRLLAQLKAPHGVYAVLGSPPVDERDVVPPLFEGLPAQLLVDQEWVVDLGDGRRLALLGMDCSHHLPTDEAKLRVLADRAVTGGAAAASGDDALPRVLLYHAPDLMPQASELGLDLYLCGHTHGGQIRVPFYGALITSSQLGKRYEMGHYAQGETQLYVSRGVGLEGLGAPRLRLLCPPEITLVTVSPASVSPVSVSPVTG